VVLLHNNVRPHTAASTRALLADFVWGILFQSSYSPDLAPSDFHLFTHFKQFLGGTRMASNEEVKKTVKDWFSGLVADFYDAGMWKLHMLQVP
jgi:histone-lysine N-methyltransferase SETMAR